MYVAPPPSSPFLWWVFAVALMYPPPPPDHLVTDDATLCFTAFERGSLDILAALVRSITPAPPEKDKDKGKDRDKAAAAAADWDEGEPESVSCLREVRPTRFLCLHSLTHPPPPTQAALTATAALSLFDNDIRRAVTSSHLLLPPIHLALTHPHVGTRYAACQCIRALSRAVVVLRTNLVDSGVGLAVLAVLKKEGEDRRVTGAALAAVCNVVNEFSPLREVGWFFGFSPFVCSVDA